MSNAERITRTHRRSRRWDYLLAAAAWGVCLYAALSLASARTAWSGALCGDWT
ncbi:MAG: hypothetical protein WD070_12615 [Pirellulaceae bacterium]